MQTLLIKLPEWTVYETGQHKEHGHSVAHYTDYGLMMSHWLNEFLAGTHNFIVKELEA
jgi:hypothetical protein